MLHPDRSFFRIQTDLIGTRHSTETARGSIELVCATLLKDCLQLTYIKTTRDPHLGIVTNLMSDIDGNNLLRAWSLSTGSTYKLGQPIK